MSNDSKIISVKLLGREYQIACPEGKEAGLTEAANLLDHKMAEIRATGRVFGLERIAIMAAVNMAHALLTEQNFAQKHSQDLSHQLEVLNDKLEEVLKCD